MVSNNINKNKKGFTMVELLATIVILGVLAGIGVPLVYKYLNKAKNNSYDHMLTGAYDAANNKILGDNYSCTKDSPCTFKLSTLVDEGYIENLDDPSKHGSACDGVIEVASSSGIGLKSYDYVCYLKCSNYSTTVKWSAGAAANDYDSNYSDMDADTDRLKNNLGLSDSDALITKIKIKSKDITLSIGDTSSLNVEKVPKGSSESITWWSSNTAVVTVDDNGKLTAIGSGEATIVAKSKNAVDKIKVTVKGGTKSDGVDIYQSGNIADDKKLSEVKLEYGSSMSLTAKITPDGVADDKLEWTSSNSNLVSIIPKDNNTVLISAIKNVDNVAVITVKTSNGKTSTVSVRVVSKKSNVSVDSVEINPNSFQLKRGSSLNLMLYTAINPPYAADRTLAWSSSNPSAVSVDKNGKVVALKSSGTYTISATSTNGKVAYTTIVLGKPDPSRISVDKSMINLRFNENDTVNANVLPTDSDQTVLWDNSNCGNTVLVDSIGNNKFKITAKKNEPTSCVLHVSSNDRKKHADVVVNILPILASKITIEVDQSLVTSSNTITLDIGSNTKLTAKVSPDNVTTKNIRWESSDSSIASIDSNGTVSAKNPGSVIIKAISDNVLDEIKVVVKKPDVSEIKVEPSELSLKFGDTYTIKTTVLPENAVQTVSWDVSNCNGVVSADKDGKITVIKNQVISCNIHAKASNNKEAIVALKVIEIPVTNISLNVDSLDLIYHKSAKLVATVLPSNATYTNVIWSSSDPSLASVSSDGTVRALKYDNTVNITATAGGKSVSIPVNLKRPEATGVSISSPNVSLKFGEEKTIDAVVVPSDAIQTITWDQSDCDGIVSLDANGKIKALQNKVSSCKLVASANNGVKAEVSVKVEEIPVTNVSFLDVDVNNGLTMAYNSTISLKTSISPDDATNKELKWTSNDTTLAKVDNNGKVTIESNKIGIVTITATSNNNKEASIKIKVFPGGDYVAFSSNYNISNSLAPHIKIKKRDTAVVQSFALDSNSLYLSQQTVSGQNYSNISKLSLGDLVVGANYTNPNLITNMSYFENFGNLYNIDIETTGTNKYLWADCGTYACDLGTCNYTCRIPIGKLSFGDGSSASSSYYYYDVNKSSAQINNLKSDFSPKELSKIRYTDGFLPAVDSKNRILVAMTGTRKNHEFTVYNIDDFIDNTTVNTYYKTTISNPYKTKAEVLYQFKIDSETFNNNTLGLISRQGFAVNGNYIYSYEGDKDSYKYLTSNDSNLDLEKCSAGSKTITISGNNYNLYECPIEKKNAYISVWSLSGESKVFRQAIEHPTVDFGNSCYSKIGSKYYSCNYLWVPQGIKVYNGNVYLGFAVDERKITENNGVYEAVSQGKKYYVFKLVNK